MAIIFLFVDGVGLAPAGENNPFSRVATPFLSGLLGGENFTLEAADRFYDRACLLALDATLGVAGLPQSATGQATLFTGINAAGLLGFHLRGVPARDELQKLLAEKGLFKHFLQNDLCCTFANAYKPEFFQEFTGEAKRSYSCSTLINLYAGLPFRGMAEMLAGKAVYMDITNEILQKLGYDIPLITPQLAGKRLTAISREYDLILYEHFLTDVAGHNGDQAEKERVIRTFDAFLGEVVRTMDQEGDLLLMVSDHGNLEDSRVKTHTDNPVPALLVGRGREKTAEFLQEHKDLTGILPALDAWFEQGMSGGRGYTLKVCQYPRPPDTKRGVYLGKTETLDEGFYF